jgi:solute carrier family 25 carnitine/acylcarnitine transporter 20/29
MLPRRPLTTAVLALLSISSRASQIPFGPNTAPAPASITLVDVLSADPDYTTLLRVVQRARLIPTLNRMVNSTFFAPTNDAIERSRERDSFWLAATSEDEYSVYDNIHERLRDELLYHLINYTISGDQLSKSSNPVEHDTLHFPRQPTEAPGRGPPPFPPWMPIPGGSLGGKPQRIRTQAKGSEYRVGVDALGRGGVKVVKDRQHAANGVVIGIEDVLTVPPNLGQWSVLCLVQPINSSPASVIAQQDSLSYLKNIMTDQLSQLLNDTSAMTLFLPVNSAWDTLDSMERLYLESEYASDDLHKILAMHAVVQDDVAWSDSFEKDLKRESDLLLG